MVNWHDPVLLLEDYIAFVKLSHVVAGAYIWETVFTVGFELDVLRGKRPYRWTIWLYLGTRYAGLCTFITLFIDIDGTRVPCEFPRASFVLGYASWSFASLIIILRIIAIWNRNIIVSLIAIGVWLGGLASNIRHLAIIILTYSPLVNTCIVLHARSGLVNAVGMLVVDVVLLLTMLVGLLRHRHRSSTGIWKLLYQQCIIWLALALIAETPVVVFLILNLNDAWDQILSVPAIAILSIGAARMYRSLSDRGSLTEYVSSDLPQFSSEASNPTAQRMGTNVYGPIQFASAPQTSGTQAMYEAPVFVPADQIHVEFVPGGSIPSLAQENTKDNTDLTVYEMV